MTFVRSFKPKQTNNKKTKGNNKNKTAVNTFQCHVINAHTGIHYFCNLLQLQADRKGMTSFEIKIAVLSICGLDQLCQLPFLSFHVL